MLLSLATGLFLQSVAEAQTLTAELEASEEQAFKQAAALVSESIVRIQTVGGVDRVGRVLTGTGPTTGVVVSEDGYIISSTFNFISRPASVLVTLPDNRRFAARTIASDRSRMLTLLKIDADGLIPIRPVPKSELRVGQWAIALGRTYDSPLPNMSVGIVSALDRVWGKAIQTDAKISPANYGGPLVDIEGRVMGVLVPLSPQESEDTAGVEWYDSGIGFAIASEDVFAVLERLKTGTDLRPGLLGINLKGKDLYASPPIIDRVRYDSPAQKAGLEVGDLIVELDGQPIVRQAQLKQVLGTKYEQEKLTIVVKRGDERLSRELELAGELTAWESAFLGILPVRKLRTNAGTDMPLAGVAVRHVFDDSPAAKAGLKPRDRILRFNDTEVNDSASLADLVGRLRPEEKAKLAYSRDMQENSLEIALSKIPDTVPESLSSDVIPSVAEPEKDDNGKDADNADNDADKDNNDGQDEAADRPASTVKTGRFTETPAGYEQSYWAYVPEDYNPQHAYSLLVWIHPDGDTMEAAIYKDWKLLCDQRGIILVGPKAAKVGGWNADEADFVQATVNEMRDRYSIDDRRVALHGFSSGGTFAYFLTFKHRELYRGVAAVAAPLRARPPENMPEFPLQFHLVCGESDELLRLVEGTANGLRQLKFPCSFTKVPELDHRYPPAARVEEIARWFDALDRI